MFQALSIRVLSVQPAPPYLDLALPALVLLLGGVGGGAGGGGCALALRTQQRQRRGWRQTSLKGRRWRLKRVPRQLGLLGGLLGIPPYVEFEINWLKQFIVL